MSRETAIRVGKNSTVLAERRFYADTYLHDDDDHSWLFITDAAVVRGPSGRETVRTFKDVLAFDSGDEMAEAIRAGKWVESDEIDGNPRWQPTREAIEHQKRWFRWSR